MFGDGASAFLSLKLGEKNKIDAGKGIGAGILLSVGISLLYTLLVFIFWTQFWISLVVLREFAIIAFRTYLMFCIVNGIQIPAGIFFQAIGKSIKSAIVSLSRQIVILISSMILLGYFFEIRGLLYSGPLAEGLAFLIGEIRKLNINDDKCINVLDNINYKEDIDKDENNNKNIIITIAREYGSGGRYIGKLVADKLGIIIW